MSNPNTDISFTPSPNNPMPIQAQIMLFSPWKHSLCSSICRWITRDCKWRDRWWNDVSTALFDHSTGGEQRSLEIVDWLTVNMCCLRPCFLLFRDGLYREGKKVIVWLTCLYFSLSRCCTTCTYSTHLQTHKNNPIIIIHKKHFIAGQGINAQKAAVHMCATKSDVPYSCGDTLSMKC